MTTSLFRVYQTGDDLTQGRVAPGPSGGTYFADGAFLTETVRVALINAAGAVSWKKELTIGASDGFSGQGAQIASNGTYLAVAIGYTDSTSSEKTTAVILYDSSGTIVWQKTLPIATDAGGSALLVDSTNAVIIAGSFNFDADNFLVKLNGTTGAVDWAVNTNASTGSYSFAYSWPAALLSTGDVIACVRGPSHTDGAGTSSGYLQRIDGTTGAITWTRSLTWGSGDSYASVAVDASDEIYVAVAGHVYSAEEELPLLKVDASGTVLWSRNVQCPAGLVSHHFLLGHSDRMVADSTGVYVPTYFGNSGGTPHFGHVFVPAAGTIASGNVVLSTYPCLNNTVLSSAAGSAAGGIAAQILMTYVDEASGGGSDYAVVLLSDSTTGDDGTYGLYTRTSYAYDLATGTGAASSYTYTRASTPSFSIASATVTESASTLATDVTVPSRVVTSLGPTSAFGVCGMVGAMIANPAAFAQFGTPLGNKRTETATAVSPTTTFGAGALNLNKVLAAATVGTTTTFGDGWVNRYPADAPFTVSGLAPTTTFGAPVETSTYAGTASGFTGTQFPTASSVVPRAATTVGVDTNFGAPTLTLKLGATALASTTFGAAASLRPVLAAGFISGHFGTPRSTPILYGVAEGWASTLFGTSVLGSNALHTRSALFRTGFGLAQAERTAP